MKKKYFIMDFMIDEKVSGNDFPQCYNFMKGVNLPDYFAIETPVLFNYYVISEHLLQAITENDLTGLKVGREIYVSSPD